MNTSDMSSIIGDAVEFFTVIEITPESGGVKYEMDKDVGALFVDRFMPTSFCYPSNYGFIPNTLSGDGDPCDVLLHTSAPIQNGCIVKCKAIGVLLTEDESGQDEKIIALPSNKIDPSLAHINDYRDMGEFFIKKIQHFYEHYKDLEDGKWVKMLGVQDSAFARDVILKSVQRYKQS